MQFEPTIPYSLWRWCAMRFQSNLARNRVSKSLVVRVVTRMDTLKSGWTNYVYYTELMRVQSVSYCFPLFSVFLSFFLCHHVFGVKCPTWFQGIHSSHNLVVRATSNPIWISNCFRVDVISSLGVRVPLWIRPQFFKGWMTLSTGLIAIQWTSVIKTNDAIHWTVIYLVNRAVSTFPEQPGPGL